MSAIAVSIFIKQSGPSISISSLAADDAISKSIEHMLIEQTSQVIKFIDAATLCAEEIVDHQAGKS